MPLFVMVVFVRWACLHITHLIFSIILPEGHFQCCSFFSICHHLLIISRYQTGTGVRWYCCASCLFLKRDADGFGWRYGMLASNSWSWPEDHGGTFCRKQGCFVFQYSKNVSSFFSTPSLSSVWRKERHKTHFFSIGFSNTASTPPPCPYLWCLVLHRPIVGSEDHNVFAGEPVGWN